MKIRSLLPSFWISPALRAGALAVFILPGANSAAVAGANIKDSYNLDLPAAPFSFYTVSNVGWTYTPSFNYTLTGVETRFAAAGGQPVTVEIWSGVPSSGGTLLRSAVYQPTSQTLAGPTFAPLPLKSGTQYFVGFKNVVNLTNNITSALGARFLDTVYYDYGDGTYSNSQSHFDNTPNTQPILAFLGPTTGMVVYQKGDPVKNMPGATFKSFGVPAIDAEQNRIAFLGKWTSPTGSGAGIVADDNVVAKVGDVVLPGVVLKSLKDPVINGAAGVAFVATLTGVGITSANDSAVLGNINATQQLKVVAQEGTQAADAPPGALWRSFTSVAATDDGKLLFLGTMTPGAGGITAANDNGLWCQTPDEVLHLVLQEGTTQIEGKTIRSFVVLKTVSGSPGQTHAFSRHADLVVKVTFTDGSQAVVHLDLP